MAIYETYSYVPMERRVLRVYYVRLGLALSRGPHSTTAASTVALKRSARTPSAVPACANGTNELIAAPWRLAVSLWHGARPRGGPGGLALASSLVRLGCAVGLSSSCPWAVAWRLQSNPAMVRRKVVDSSSLAAPWRSTAVGRNVVVTTTQHTFRCAFPNPSSNTYRNEAQRYIGFMTFIISYYYTSLQPLNATRATIEPKLEAVGHGQFLYQHLDGSCGANVKRPAE
jgi:hypothetical protein